jgi:SulP family sulfate permease
VRPHRSARDIVAGISVALVLIPQSMAYAELAGLPGSRGLYAAAVAPLAAAFFASSPYLQTGPVALTSLLTLGALLPMAPVATPEYIGLAAILALVVGVARVVIGLGKAGWVSYLMSQPMLEGFTTGAALLIIGSQVPGALGTASPTPGVVAGVLWALSHPSTWHASSIVLTAFTVLAVFGCRRIHPLLPGVLVATVVGLGFSVLTGYEGPQIGAIEAGLPPFTLRLPWTALPSLLLAGTVIALVGFAEAASIARTFATQERQRWDPSREFVSQGLANLAAGFGGGFPVGGSFSRSSLNHMAGATSRWSGAITGAAVLAFLPFAGVLAALPTAILAGIVISAVLGLVRVRSLARLWRLSKAQAAVGWGTFALTIALSPRVDHAVVLGMGAALAVHVLREMGAKADTRTIGTTLHLHPKGVLWYGSVPVMERSLLNGLADAEDAEAVVIHLGGLGRIDLPGALILEQIVDDARSAGLDTQIVDVPHHAYRILGRVLGWTPEGGLPEPPRRKRGRSRDPANEVPSTD